MFFFFIVRTKFCDGSPIRREEKDPTIWREEDETGMHRLKEEEEESIFLSVCVSVSVCASLLLSVVSRFVSDVLYE